MESQPRQSSSASAITLELVREMMGAGNELAELLDQERPIDGRIGRDEAKAALARWEAALYAIGRAA